MLRFFPDLLEKMRECHIRVAVMKKLSLCLALGLLVAAKSATAVNLTLEFLGSANFAGNLAPYFQVGDPIRFEVTYDTAAAPIGGSETSSFFNAQSISFTINGSGGDWTASYTSPGIQVEHFPTYQRITFSSDGLSIPPGINNPIINGRELSIGTLTFYTDTTISNPLPLNVGALPSTFTRSQWSVNPSSSGAFFYFSPGGGQDFMRYSITEVNVIPEPSTYAFVGAGVVALYLLARRRFSR